MNETDGAAYVEPMEATEISLERYDGLMAYFTQSQPESFPSKYRGVKDFLNHVRKYDLAAAIKHDRELIKRRINSGIQDFVHFLDKFGHRSLW